MSLLNKPILNDINNGISTARMGMPMKDITSDGSASFGLNRKLFTRTFITPITKPNVSGIAIIERNALGLSGKQVIITGPASAVQKKWIGGNRDASQITTNRRVIQSGKVMANVNNQPTSFVTDNDRNTTRHALSRVRGGGAANVPKAKARISSTANVFPNAY